MDGYTRPRQSDWLRLCRRPESLVVVEESKTLACWAKALTRSRMLGVNLTMILSKVSPSLLSRRARAARLLNSDFLEPFVSRPQQILFCGAGFALVVATACSLRFRGSLSVDDESGCGSPSSDGGWLEASILSRYQKLGMPTDLCHRACLHGVGHATPQMPISWPKTSEVVPSS